MDQELVQYLEERFDRHEQRFNARFDAIDQRFDRVEQRLDSHNQQFASIDQRFVSIDERFDELKRHTGVLVEGLRHEVQLLAEGFATFIEVRYMQDQTNIDQQFRETRALIHLSYDQLRQRVENLERKSPN
jgi:septation ring formation regulator EzrA